ncbi:uncharacterized protein LOC134216676 [Armigeres subalbatus]|uniref:uncharacterized protein LOC134216676 n=1 Tax=Armigeres subalbatus TaxID=124917 RepID=UPI002ED47B85
MEFNPSDSAGGGSAEIVGHDSADALEHSADHGPTLGIVYSTGDDSSGALLLPDERIEEELDEGEEAHSSSSVYDTDRYVCRRQPRHTAIVGTKDSRHPSPEGPTRQHVGPNSNRGRLLQRIVAERECRAAYDPPSLWVNWPRHQRLFIAANADRFPPSTKSAAVPVGEQQSNPPSSKDNLFNTD